MKERIYDNLPQQSERRKKYRQTEHGKLVTRLLAMRRRKNILGKLCNFDGEKWKYSLKFFDYKCFVCERPQGGGFMIVPDHWVPIKRGGAHIISNIVPMCHSLKGSKGGCNNQKSAKEPVKWLKGAFPNKASKVLKKIEQYRKSLWPL